MPIWPLHPPPVHAFLASASPPLHAHLFGLCILPSMHADLASAFPPPCTLIWPLHPPPVHANLASASPPCACLFGLCLPPPPCPLIWPLHSPLHACRFGLCIPSSMHADLASAS